MSAGSAPLLVDRNDRLRMTLGGELAKATLGGLVTNDVTALTAGDGQRAVALTPKGRVIALLRVFDRGDHLLVDTDAAAGPGFVAMIRKYVNPRLAKYADVSAVTACVGLYGVDAALPLARALCADPGVLDALAPLAGTWCGEGEAAAYVVRSTDLAPAGFDVIASPARTAELRAALVAGGAEPASDEAVAVARVEAGVPEWGREMDAETIPQEANLDALGAISFTKGCYTGQEVVARIHFRGHVNRHLRRLAAREAIPAGARVLDAEGKDVGDVRTSVISPTHGPLAIAMVRREVEPGSAVRIVGPGAEIAAQVLA